MHYALFVRGVTLMRRCVFSLLLRWLREVKTLMSREWSQRPLPLQEADERGAKEACAVISLRPLLSLCASTRRLRRKKMIKIRVRVHAGAPAFAWRCATQVCKMTRHRYEVQQVHDNLRGAVHGQRPRPSIGILMHAQVR